MIETWGLALEVLIYISGGWQPPDSAKIHGFIQTENKDSPDINNATEKWDSVSRTRRSHI